MSVSLLDLALGIYLVELIAVRLDAKGQRVGDAAMNEAIQWVTAHADINGVKYVSVVADCHPRNKRAKALLKRKRFVRVRVDEHREEWAYDFALNSR